MGGVRRGRGVRGRRRRSIRLVDVAVGVGL